MVNSFAASPNPEIAELATHVLDVVLPAPKMKRGRGKKSTLFTDAMRKEICSRWEKAGLIEDEDDTGVSRACKLQNDPRGRGSF